MDTIRLTHIGGPTTLIEVGPWRLLTDPTFDPPGRRYAFGWGTSSRKTAGPAVSVAQLGPVDAVLLTHDQHADNLDDAGRALLPKAGTVITTRAGARRLGGNAIGLDPWQETRLESAGRPHIYIKGTPCRHGSLGLQYLSGDVIGFGLQWEGQRHGVTWITGDTVVHKGLSEVPKRMTVGTMLLHLGGVRFPVTGPLRFTMTARRAADMVALVRPRTVVPIHFEGWSHFESKNAYAAAMSSLPDTAETRLQQVTPGTTIEIKV